MNRRLFCGRSLVILLIGLIVGLLPLGSVLAQSGPTNPRNSSPPDKTKYVRPVVPQDLHPTATRGALVPAAFLRDPIMSNPSPNGSGGSEPDIAVNPSNPNQIVVAAGFGGWNGNARLFYSTDGGNNWTTNFTIPVPPNGAGTSGCPCDQTFDYDRAGNLYGTFLTSQVYSGGTTDPTSAAAWTWATTGSPPTAVTTNQAAQTSVDQPWLLVNRDPTNAAQDDVYVAYDDFTTNPGVPLRVAESTGGLPLNFTRNALDASSTAGPGNPGHRLANDRRSGAMYSLHSSGAGGNNFNYILNRTSDAGQTWTLNGSSDGFTVVSSPSNFGGKFGTVNALLGGVDHAAVDPVTGYVYVVYGALDGSGNNRIAIKRLQDNGTGTLVVSSTANVTTQGSVQAALPSVAVTDNETVGVLYTTFDGFSSVQDPSNPGNFFPIFSAHFAASTDLGATFNDTVLETFLSPATSTNPSDSQRVLGDFQQVKAVGNTFYGTFSGNGSQFGTTNSQIDPIFFKVSAAGPQITVTGDLNFGTVPQGTTADRNVIITNTGSQALVVNGVSFGSGSDPSFSVLPTPGVPQTLQPSDSVTYIVRFSPPTGTTGGTRNGTLVINSSDPLNPVVNLAATGSIGIPRISVSGDLNFGTVARGTTATRQLTVNNTGQAPLNVSSVVFLAGSDPSFSVLGPATPQSVPVAGSVTFTVQFAPPATAAAGTLTGTLQISSNDPVTPTVNVPATGIVGTPKVSFSSTALSFGAVAVDDRTNPHTSDQTLVISNQASCAGCDVSLNSLPITGPNASDFSVVGPPPLPATIAAGNSLTLTIRFDPTAGGVRTATLTVNTSDPGDPSQPVSLTGTGLVPAIAASPNPLIFGPTVLDPACVAPCGQTMNVSITNNGLAELILDALSVSGSPAFSAAAPTNPLTRVQPSGSFNEPVTFHPTGITPARALRGTLSITQNVAGAVPPLAISQDVALCGEAVGRGIRVLAVDTSGNPLTSLSQVRLQSFGTVSKVNVNSSNLSLTTISPPTSCQQIQFQYENQNLQTTDTAGGAQPGSQYTLTVVGSNGSHQAKISFTLAINEFKVITVTVP